MPRIGEVGRTLRNVKRYQEILAALLRFGFYDFVADTRLDQWIGLQDPGDAAALAEGETKLPRAVRLRRMLEALGPTFIKLGQILSTRPDLIAPDLVDEFKKLQDRCPCLDFDHFRRTLETEFPGQLDEIFESIDETPLAAASLAQVHRAKLRDGSKVVVKILRPGVRSTIRADMEVLTRIAEFVEWHFSEVGYSATDVVKEFAGQLKRECDLTLEGRSTDRLREFFRGDRRIKFPTVYWRATTRSVLTVEEIEGTPLSRMDITALTAEDRRRIVAIGSEAVLKQCLQFGFFHADPHPGNIFICPDGSICFIDCGMTGHLDRTTSELLADLLMAVLNSDTERAVSVIIALTNADPGLGKDRRFRQDLWKVMAHFESGSFQTLDVPQVLNEFFAVLRSYSIRCPADLVFLIKAITTIEGVGEEIDPSFDIFANMQPYLERLMRRRFGAAAVRQRVVKGLLRYAEFAENLPQELQALLAQVRTNRFNVNLEHKNLDHLTQSIEHVGHNVSTALIITGLLVCSSLLILAARIAAGDGHYLTVLGLSGIIGALALIVILAINNYRYRQR